MMGVYFSDFVDINPRVNLEKGKEYPFVEMGEVDPVRRYVNGLQKRLFKGGGTKFRSGDTLFARITPCLENGKIAQFISSEQIGFGSTEFFVFRAVPNISDPGFVYYLSRSDLIRQPAEKSMTGASGRQRADLNSIVNVEVPVVSLTAQRKIAAILSAYDDLIENNLWRIKILEEMAQNLYREWFVNFCFPGHEQTRFVDSPLGRIPEGWVVKGLIDFGEIITGKTPSKIRLDYYGDDVPFIKLPDMHNNIYCTQTIDNLSKSGADSQKSKTLPPNSLCVSCIGTVGKVAITACKSQTNQQINSIIPYRRDNLEFLFFSLLGLKEIIELYSATGATMNNLSRGKFISLRVITPSEKLIKEYHDLASPNFRAILNLQLKNEMLKKTRDLLLPKLISGDVDISELDIKVPEEVAI